MVYRKVIICVLFSSVLLTGEAGAQPGDRHLEMKPRVLDILFPLDAGPTPYFSKMVLRFSDSNTQLVVVTYPGAKSELLRYSLDSMSGGEFSQLISKMVAENPDVKPQEIAARLKVNVIRLPIEPGALRRSLDELKAIRISPVLASRVAVDEFSEYEFWYDNWQESVHYVITSPFGNDPQDELGRWMVKFRDIVPNLSKSRLEPTPAKPGRGEE